MFEVVMRSKSLLNQFEFRRPLPISTNQDLLNFNRANTAVSPVTLVAWALAGIRGATILLSYENASNSGNEIDA
ncbi:hypothetical protein [Pandoraea bronchicola]|uniref:hypothetical protein n=1 Tax=Pandoraea bronchicola TaxID=2508287 RepID=UPI00123F3193|nr:hypothetical protein [Pandoraea bronchicola]